MLQYFSINQNFNFTTNKLGFYSNQLGRVNSIIIFKKKSSLFKKNIDFEYTILNKINFNRDDFFKNNFNEELFLSIDFLKIDYRMILYFEY